MWKRRQTRITQFSVKQDLVKIHCPTLFVPHTLGGRRVGWIMTFVISAILDGCARFACFSIPFLSCISESNVGPCWTNLSNGFFSLFLPRSLRPLVTRVTRNSRFSHTCINISLSPVFSHIRAYLSAFTLAKDLPKVSVHERVGRGENSVITYIYKLA